jgi:hypothetical protein
VVVVIVLVIAAIVTVAAFVTYRHLRRAPAAKTPTQAFAAPPPSPPPMQAANNQLDADFRQFAAGLPAKVGIAFSAVGTGQVATVLGDWQEGPAWSTSKVPLVLAAYRKHQPPLITDTMRAAITESDNAAAESIWASLGEPAIAAEQVQQILRENGDPTTTVESRKVRPEFTAFGQTIWSLANQVRFMASAFCDGENKQVFDLMGQIEANQSWGIGGIPDTLFKGGWGPSSSGKYLVRQFGVLTTPTGKVSVAIATEPESGQFAAGTQQLGELTKWLKDRVGALPAGQCGR